MRNSAEQGTMERRMKPLECPFTGEWTPFFLLPRQRESMPTPASMRKHRPSQKRSVKLLMNVQG